MKSLSKIEHKKQLQREKQKRYRARKIDNGCRCVQIYLAPNATQFIDNEISLIHYENRYNFEQDDLDKIPPIKKADYSTVINDVLSEQATYQEKNKDFFASNIQLIIELLSNKFGKKVEFESLFNELQEDDFRDILRSLELSWEELSLEREKRARN